MGSVENLLAQNGTLPHNAKRNWLYHGVLPQPHHRGLSSYLLNERPNGPYIPLKKRKNKVAGNAIFSYVPAHTTVLCDQNLDEHVLLGKLEVSREPSLLGVPPTQEMQGPRKRRAFPHLSSKQKDSPEHTEAHRPPFPNSPGRSLSLSPRASQNYGQAEALYSSASSSQTGLPPLSDAPSFLLRVSFRPVRLPAPGAQWAP